MHVVVLAASEATAAGGGPPRARHRGAPVGGRLLARVREALSEAAQVLPVAVLAVRKIRLGCRGLAHVWGSLRRGRREGERRCPWGGRRRRNPRRGKLIRWRGRRAIAET